MVKYSYAYKDSKGLRHEAMIEAGSRDAAFAALRAQGIRPIKVVAADGSIENGSATSAPRKRIRKTAVLAVALAIVASGLAVYVAMRGFREERPHVVMTPQGPVTFTMATPLARQRIPGDRARIENLPTNLFAHVGEAFLARYAEPGRAVEQIAVADPDSLFTRDVLKSPIRVASNDLTEYVDLKRIVVGMKREMRMYIEGGGTVRNYLAELAKRQLLEVSYRDRAAKRLGDLIAECTEVKPDADQKGSSESFARAYDFWLKANAQLQSMGIYPLELPDELRAYQLTLDFDE